MMRNEKMSFNCTMRSDERDKVCTDYDAKHKEI